MSAAALVIAAENLMPGLRERLKVEGDILSFSDTEPIQALQAIMDQRPGLVVLERLFAATPRGAALINRIKSDPQLANAEVRVMSHTGDYSRQVVKPSTALRRRRPSSRVAPRPERRRPSPVATAGRAAAARLARHAAGAALPPPPGRRAAARRQPRRDRRPLHRRRAGHLAHRPAARTRKSASPSRTTTSCCASAAPSPGRSSSCPNRR